MKWICGSCKEVIQEIHTSRYDGGSIPCPCGSITTFEPTDHPFTPKAIDVRPYVAEKVAVVFTDEQLAAIAYVESHGYSREQAEKLLANEGAEKLLKEKAQEDAETAEQFAREQANPTKFASNLSDAGKDEESAAGSESGKDASESSSAPENGAKSSDGQKPESKRKGAR